MASFKSRHWGKVTIVTEKYANNGALCVRLLCEGDEGFQEPLATLSVNMVASEALPERCFRAKDYSENAGIAEEALASGLFKVRDEFPPLRSGFVVASVWELLP